MSRQPVAVVTGAGSGIGRAVATSLGTAGWRVVLVGRTETSLAQTASRIDSAEVVCCDVGDPASLRDVGNRLQALAAVDAVVNCAAQTIPGRIGDVDPAMAERLWRVNVMGPMLLVQECLPLLRRGCSPVVVNVTTSIGQRGWPGSGVYAATKAALESLTRTWAVELASDGIRVVAVAPGAVETGMAASTGATAEQVATLRQWQREHTPLGRIANAEEVAEVVQFLCTSAGFVTGAVIAVDGGAVIA